MISYWSSFKVACSLTQKHHFFSILIFWCLECVFVISQHSFTSLWSQWFISLESLGILTFCIFCIFSHFVKLWLQGAAGNQCACSSLLFLFFATITSFVIRNKPQKPLTKYCAGRSSEKEVKKCKKRERKGDSAYRPRTSCQLPRWRRPGRTYPHSAAGSTLAVLCRNMKAWITLQSLLFLRAHVTSFAPCGVWSYFEAVMDESNPSMTIMTWLRQLIAAMKQWSFGSILLLHVPSSVQWLELLRGHYLQDKSFYSGCQMVTLTCDN